MKLKEREADDFFLYFKRFFSWLFRIFFNKTTRKAYNWILILIIFIIGIFIGLVVSGYFGTFDQPSGRAFALLTSVGIDSSHDLKVFTEGLLKENAKIPINYVKGQFSNPEKLFINIGFKDYQQLEFKRQGALDLGLLISSGADFVPATIIHDRKKYDVKIRLKGDLPDHWDGDKWSLRIKVKNDSILGMTIFSIQNPATRQEINEMIYQKALRREGVIGLRYQFVEVAINGEEKGIYALEEHFSKELIENNSRREGIIFKFDEDTTFENSAKKKGLVFDFAESFYGSPITTFENEEKIMDDPVKLAQFKKGFGLLESLRDGSLKPHEIFDVDKTAKYYAIGTLLNCPHGGVWHNIRIYYNPVNSFLEPIGFDGNCRKDGGGDTLREYVPQCIGFSNSEKECVLEPRDFSDLVLSDVIIFEKYLQELDRISKKEYLDDLFNDLDDEINNAINIIHKEKPFYHFSREGYYNGQQQIRDLFTPLVPVNVYFDRSFVPKNKILLALGNINSLPIEILNMEYNGTFFPLVDPKERMLQSRDLSGLQKYKQIEFKIPEDFEWKVEYSFDSVVNYKIFGVNVKGDIPIFPLPYVEEDFAEQDFIRKEPDLSSFDMLEVKEASRIIEIKRGSWILDRDLTIPSGFSLVAREGTTIDLITSAMILSHSKIDFQGSKENPIKIFSSDGTGQGLSVLNPSKTSTLEYVVFSNLTSPSKEGWELLGAVNFHETSVELTDVKFLGMHSEDSLNLINSNFKIENVFFEDCESDCLDVDFGNGSITNSDFNKCGDDCIDFSGSTTILENIKIFDAGDKALSIGERSDIIAKDIIISGDKKALIGIASKDLSRIVLDGLDISNVKYAFAVYQKKTEYGPAIIYSRGTQISDVENEYIVEENSELKINERIVLEDKINVYEILYGK